MKRAVIFDLDGVLIDSEGIYFTWTKEFFEENGILIKPGDVPALAEALLRCSRDVEGLRKMGKRNRKRAEQEFGIRRMHGRLAGYYRQVMDQGGV